MIVMKKQRDRERSIQVSTKHLSSTHLLTIPRDERDASCLNPSFGVSVNQGTEQEAILSLIMSNNQAGSQPEATNQTRDVTSSQPSSLLSMTNAPGATLNCSSSSSSSRQQQSQQRSSNDNSSNKSLLSIYFLYVLSGFGAVALLIAFSSGDHDIHSNSNSVDGKDNSLHFQGHHNRILEESKISLADWRLRNPGTQHERRQPESSHSNPFVATPDSTAIQRNGSTTRSTTSSIKEIQKQNFRNGNGLLLNIHLTHHGGTSFCKYFRQFLSSPEFACMGIKTNNGKNKKKKQSQQDHNNSKFPNHPMNRVTPKIKTRTTTVPSLPSQNNHNETTSTLASTLSRIHRERPWSFDGTDAIVQLLLQHRYRLFAQEYGFRKPYTPPLDGTNWEHEQLVSVLVMRHPQSRLLATDHFVCASYGCNPWNRTRAQWWSYATLDRPKHSNTDNFMLHKFSSVQKQQHPDVVKKNTTTTTAASSHNDNNNNNDTGSGLDPMTLETLTQTGMPCCKGENTSRIHLESAKALIRRFTYVLDIECLDQGMQALAQELGLLLDDTNIDNVTPSSSSNLTTIQQQRLPNPKQQKRRYDPRELLPHNDIYEYLLRRNRLDIELYTWSKQLSLVNCDQQGIGGRSSM